MRNASQHATDATLQASLDARYGVTMSTQEVAETLKMSVAALRMARSRQQFPLQPIPIDGRRHQIYCTKEVGAFLLARLAARGRNPTQSRMMAGAAVPDGCAAGALGT